MGRGPTPWTSVALKDDGPTLLDRPEADGHHDYRELEARDLCRDAHQTMTTHGHHLLYP